MKMLTECYRVLRPGGVLRVVTPDTRFLVDLYRDPDSEVHRRYVAWSASVFIGQRTPHDAVSVINNFFRDWGHCYIYDLDAMMQALRVSGFVDIAERQVGASEYVDLQGLEHPERMPPEYMALESMVLEATKPANAEPRAPTPGRGDQRPLS